MHLGETWLLQKENRRIRLPKRPILTDVASERIMPEVQVRISKRTDLSESTITVIITMPANKFVRFYSFNAIGLKIHDGHKYIGKRRRILTL